MNKKVISLKTFEKRRKDWIKKFDKNKKVKKLARKLFIESDKCNY